MKSFNRFKYFLLNFICLTLVVSINLVQAQTISKCQDADGNWHYGDYASEECDASSTVTEIDRKGNTVRENDAPPSQEELDKKAADKKAKQQKAAEKAKQKTEDRKLVAAYDSSEAVALARDQRVASFEKQIRTNEQFKKELVDELATIKDTEENKPTIDNIKYQIEEYDNAINAAKTERDKVITKFDAMEARYKELEGQVQ